MTPKQIVQLQREAATRAWRHLESNTREAGLASYLNLYHPMPKATRPRMVPDPEEGYSQGWRVADGVLQRHPHLDGASVDSTAWRGYPTKNHTELSGVLFPTPARIKLWADLWANPTELVEE